MGPHQTGRRRWTRTGRAVVLVALVVSAVFLGPRPAEAHTELVGSTPAAGDVVSVEIDRLTLVFDTELVPDAGDVTVRDSTGAEVTVGDPVVFDRTLEIGVAMGEPGRHEVSYRVTGSDGHAVVGSYVFDAALPASDLELRADRGAPVPAAASTPVPSGADRRAPSSASVAEPASFLGAPWIPWAVLGASAVAVLVVVRRLSDRKVVERVDDRR